MTMTTTGIDVPEEGRPTRPTGGASALIGEDSNGFAILGVTGQILRRAGASRAFVDAMRRDGMSGDYDHLLAVAMAYLDSAPEGEDDECAGDPAHLHHSHDDDEDDR